MRALISVSDKRGVADFAAALSRLGWEIIATGGTQRLLEQEGVKTIGISEVTGFPEICDGRVKTLHPKVHGALLGRRDLPSHLQALRENGIEFIDLVCVNLYPFAATIAKPGVTMEDAVENIDIGGPSMLRSAAKNWRDVTVVCDPADYAVVLDEIRASGNTKPETRLTLSAKAYTHTAQYDTMIARYMRAQAGLPGNALDGIRQAAGNENARRRIDFFRFQPGYDSVSELRLQVGPYKHFICLKIGLFPRLFVVCPSLFENPHPKICGAKAAGNTEKILAFRCRNPRRGQFPARPRHGHPYGQSVRRGDQIQGDLPDAVFL